MKKRLAAGLITAAALIALIAGPLRPQAMPDAPAADAAAQITLQTATAEEGFALAIRLSRLAVTETQPNREVLHALRPNYAHDAEALIAVSHVVAVHFQTIAAANNYWR